MSIQAGNSEGSGMLCARIILRAQGTVEIVCNGGGCVLKDGMVMGMLLVLGFRCANGSEITLLEILVMRIDARECVGMVAGMLLVLGFGCTNGSEETAPFEIPVTRTDAREGVR